MDCRRLPPPRLLRLPLLPDRLQRVGVAAARRAIRIGAVPID
jgi:hypothetical protein